MARDLKQPFRFLLILNVVYCCFGLVTKLVPAWRMFERVEPLNFTLTDAFGNPIDVRSYLPAGAYINSLRALLPVLGFICERGHHPRPLRFIEMSRGVKLEIGPGDCRVPHDL